MLESEFMAESGWTPYRRDMHIDRYTRDYESWLERESVDRPLELELEEPYSTE